MTATVGRLVSARLQLEFKSPDLRASLKGTCVKVLKQFQSIPPLRLLCYFDDEYPKWLQKQFGEFSAIHAPLIGGGLWPAYVKTYFFDYTSGELAYDNLIYIPKSKYSKDKVSFVIIFAHELQHFVQWG